MQTLRASKLGLDPNELSPAILDVIDTLSAAGYDAYIVGGGVRDLLLGLHPKDFDAVTNATPQQIRDVFGKRCRIIGRRFELAHVYSGRDMIEVATFRAPPRRPNTTAAGMITRDNVWGTIKQDFSRRDFTINALYYQPRKDQVLDFCEGVSDLRARLIRFLGNPTLRFEEDPVRMLRILRFAAKLGFAIDPEIIAVLKPALTQLLRDVSPHRLYDESQKMFSGGYLAPLLPLLEQYHVWPILFADVKANITPLIQRAADNTDARIKAGKSINPAFFYAILLWQPMLDRVAQLQAQNMASFEAWTQAGVDVLRRQQKHTAIPRFAEVFIREIWELQPRLIQPKARQVPALANHPRFRAGFDFLMLREQAGDPATQGMGEWWHNYQNLSNDDEREHAIKLLNRMQLRQRRQNIAALAGQPNAELSAEQAVSQGNTDVPTIDVPPTRAARRRQARANQVVESPEVIDMVDAEMSGLAAARESVGSRRAQAPRRKRRPRDLSQVFMGPYE